MLSEIFKDLPMIGASEPDLNIIQHFLGRCHKRRFVSFPVSIKDLLYKQDCKILKAITSVVNHPLATNLPAKKENNYSPIYTAEKFWHGSDEKSTRTKKIGSARIDFVV